MRVNKNSGNRKSKFKANSNLKVIKKKKKQSQKNLVHIKNKAKSKNNAEDCDASVILIDDNIIPTSEYIISDNEENTQEKNEVIEIMDDSTVCNDSDVVFVSETEISNVSSPETQNTNDQIQSSNTDMNNQVNASKMSSSHQNVVENIACTNKERSNGALRQQHCYPLLLKNKTLDFIPLHFKVDTKEKRTTITVTTAAKTRTTAKTTSATTKSINNNCSIEMRPMFSIDEYGNNIYNAGTLQKKGLRMIVIDGSNVAYGHANGKYFSVKGLKICIDYFLKRGHKVVAFVPHFRLKMNECSDPRLLKQLQKDGHVIATPSRDLTNKRICSYDDRFIVQCADANEGIIVSGDNFRDLMKENPKWRETIEQRLLMPTWVEDIIMFPKDPLGMKGPDLDVFLKFPD